MSDGIPDPRKPLAKAGRKARERYQELVRAEQGIADHDEVVSKREREGDSLLGGPLGPAYKVCIRVAAEFAEIKKRADGFHYIEIIATQELRARLIEELGEIGIEPKRLVGSNSGRGLVNHAFSMLRTDSDDFTATFDNLTMSVGKLKEFCERCGVTISSGLQAAMQKNQEFNNNNKQR